MHSRKFPKNCPNLTKIVHFSKKLSKFIQIFPKHLTCSVFTLLHFGSFWLILLHFASFCVIFLHFASLSSTGVEIERRWNSSEMTKLCISFSNRAKFKHFAHVANLAISTGVLAECRPRLDIVGYLLHFALCWLLLGEPRARQVSSRHWFRMGRGYQPRIDDRRISARRFPFLVKT